VCVCALVFFPESNIQYKAKTLGRMTYFVSGVTLNSINQSRKQNLMPENYIASEVYSAVIVKN